MLPSPESASIPSTNHSNQHASIGKISEELNWVVQPTSNAVVELFRAVCRRCRCWGDLSLLGLRLTCFSPQVRNAAPAAINTAIRSYASDAKAAPTEVSTILEQRIRGVQEESGLAETGRVLSVGYVDVCVELREHWDGDGPDDAHLPRKLLRSINGDQSS